MAVPGRVLLGLEEGIKVPERTLNEVIGGHLRETKQGRGNQESIINQINQLMTFIENSFCHSFLVNLLITGCT